MDVIWARYVDSKHTNDDDCDCEAMSYLDEFLDEHWAPENRVFVLHAMDKEEILMDVHRNHPPS